MSRLANISGREAVKRFAKAGYYLDHQKGNRMILYTATGPAIPHFRFPTTKKLLPDC